MTAPLDLDADRLESIRARAVQGYAPTMRDTLTLLAEVERLRAENKACTRSHQKANATVASASPSTSSERTAMPDAPNADYVRAKSW